VRTFTEQSDQAGWCVAFDPEGRRLVAGENLTLWDVETGEKLRTLRRATDTVWAATFTPDGKRIASAGDDRVVRVWDAATGQELLALRGPTREPRSLTFSADGMRLASGGWDQLVHIWDATPLTPELRERREAVSLFRSLSALKLRREELLRRLQDHVGISDSVRRRTLEFAEQQPPSGDNE
jgi:WD40 repeat protein